MESVGGDMASISNIMKYGLPLTGNLVVHAESLAAHAKLVSTAFERKVTAGQPTPEPAIWAKADEFKEKTKAFETETAKLVEVAKTSDPAALGVQMKATAKACGGCHDNFRKPKEESFKRKAAAASEARAQRRIAALTAAIAALLAAASARAGTARPSAVAPSSKPLAAAPATAT